jgi:hypothetical protein
MPDVGEVCEMLITEFEPVMPLFIGDQIIVIEIASAEIAYNIREMEFRPIKTEREWFIDRGVSGIDCGHIDVMMGDLYDIGARFSGGDV